MSHEFTPDLDLRSATKYNARASDDVGWGGKIPQIALSYFPALGSDPGSEDFAQAVLELQRSLSFDEDDRDGKLGHQTWRALLAKYDPVPIDARYVLHNGVRLTIPDRGQSYTMICRDQPGGIDIQQNAYFSRGRHPDRPINMLVWHWGSSSARRLASVLENRKISTHFGIELASDGVVYVYQYLDTWHRAWHAGGINSWSIGIDFCQQPTLKWEDRLRGRGWDVERMDNPSGRGDEECLTLEPRLLRAGQELARDLCDLYQIPMRVPRGERGMELCGDLYYGVMDDGDLQGRYSGMIPHSSASRKKWDIAPWWHSLFGEHRGDI